MNFAFVSYISLLFLLKNGYLVPELAGKLLLIEERSVGTDEACTSGTVPPVIAHPVHLYRNISHPGTCFPDPDTGRTRLTPPQKRENLKLCFKASPGASLQFLGIFCRAVYPLYICSQFVHTNSLSRSRFGLGWIRIQQSAWIMIRIEEIQYT